MVIFSMDKKRRKNILKSINNLNNLNQHIFFQKVWKRDQGELILVFKKRSSYIAKMSIFVKLRAH